MPRYVAFLRGVSPMNAKMAELKLCFEAAGFSDVRTVLSSGNVVFNARALRGAKVEQVAEAAMDPVLGRTFSTVVRRSEFLRSLIDDDPFAEFALPDGAKRVVTFLRRPLDRKVPLPIEKDGACILKMSESEVFTAYDPRAKNPAFMALIERTFGTEVTTRTLDTVKKCVSA